VTGTADAACRRRPLIDGINSERNRPVHDLRGKVAFITGAARGQGRSHAIHLAEAGASIVAVDICGQIDTVPYPMGTADDLAQTAEMVTAAGGAILTKVVDVRDLDALTEAAEAGVDMFGGLDIVVANAGTVNGIAPLWEIDEQQFIDQIDVNLTGVWRTIKATVPALLDRGTGGSVILISSISGLVAEVNVGHYAASKHGVVGLMRNLAAELAPHSIRVNCVNPTNVNTPMIDNDAYNTLFSGGKENATQADSIEALQDMNAMPVPFVEPEDISNAVLYLASDASRYVTGTNHVVDAGALGPFKAPKLASR
jgi:SDR family mycofactocin-dependent oxidoreductase